MLHEIRCKAMAPERRYTEEMATIPCDICRQNIILTLYEQHMANHDAHCDDNKYNTKPIYVSKNYDGESKPNECEICFKSYNKGDLLAYLKCKHTFHELCFLEWSKIKAICPICRGDTSK